MQLQSAKRVAGRDNDDGGERTYPPAPRWGRRFFVAGTLLLLIVVGGYFGWTGNSRRVLDNQVAAYRAAGEPIEPSDFVVTGVADDDNAVIPLREAAAGIDTKAEAWQAYEKLKEQTALPLAERELTLIRGIASANTAAFDKVDEAMRRKGVDWKIGYRSPAISILLPDLHQQRQLARLMVERAKLNYQQGDHAAAIRDLRRAMFIGRTVGHQPLLVSHLVHIGIFAMAAESLQQMQPGLKIGTGAGDAPPAEVAAVIAELLDDKPFRDGFARAMNGERMVQLDTGRAVAEGRLTLGQLGGGGAALGTSPNPVATAATYAARPMLLSDALLMIRHTTALRKAYEASPDWPTYHATAPPFPKEVENAMVRHMLAKMLLPNFQRATLNDFRGAAERRMTATALAVRWYAIDHGGKLPAKLDELVPKYLPSVPPDPFDGGPHPLRFVNHADKPLIYSIGEDGLDGGGSDLPTRSNTLPRQRTRWDKLDAVVHLKLQPRETPQAEDEPTTTEGEAEIYPNEREIREAATRATTAPATAPAPAP